MYTCVRVTHVYEQASTRVCVAYARTHVAPLASHKYTPERERIYVRIYVTVHQHIHRYTNTRIRIHYAQHIHIRSRAYTYVHNCSYIRVKRI